MWPCRFETNIGETYSFHTPNGLRQIKLLDLKEFCWPEFYTKEETHESFSYAEVTVNISGETVTLLHRPFQLPVVVNDVRICVEAIKNWATKCHIQPMIDIEKDVRFSILPAVESWGPEDLVFPINDYRWQSSPYYNTWGSLVPYNEFYYHRGEDFGAIPDHLDVVAIRPGIVIQSPITTQDWANAITVLSADNHSISYYHMNIESINPDLKTGRAVKAGDYLGKTGETWRCMHSQDWDPHLHISFHDNQSFIVPNKLPDYLYNPYSFLLAAYFKKYPDNVVAISGENYYCLPGKNVELDATLSVARPGEIIDSFSWRLSNNTTINSPLVNISYEKPGLYAEELIVRTKSGSEDRNYAHVRVYDPNHLGLVGCGFCYHYPVRGNVPGKPILFWNRLLNNILPPVYLDFGDGSKKEEISRECTHIYEKPGQYTVTFFATGPFHEPITLKMRVVVEPK